MSEKGPGLYGWCASFPLMSYGQDCWAGLSRIWVIWSVGTRFDRGSSCVGMVFFNCKNSCGSVQCVRTLGLARLFVGGFSHPCR